MSAPFEPYQSTSFQQMRSRMQTLLTPPAASSAADRKQLSLASDLPSSEESSSRLPYNRVDSFTPSPPASEGSATPASQTPLTEASDSSADGFRESDPFMRRCRGSTNLASRKLVKSDHRHDRHRPSLASKRMMSEGDVILPRPSKRSRMALNSSLRKRSLGLPSSSTHCPIVSSANSPETPSHLPSITSWRLARGQQRDRQIAKLKKALASTKPNTSLSTACKVTTPAAAPITVSNGPRPSPAKADVIPELRLLSATRTAPIGWSRFAGASAFAPNMVEAYDERDAKCAPERQRFWPIVDQQLDYTGARMLSLSSAACLPKVEVKMAYDEPVSPKSGLPPHPDSNGLLSIQQPSMPAYSQGTGTSDEDHSPLTPGAPPRTSAANHQRSQNGVSRHARDAVANESQRKATIPLSPSATLAAVIDFTRAQAASRKQPAPAAAAAAAERNAYGQLIHSPPSLRAKSQKADLAAYAPLRIAPRRNDAGSSKGRDYFGHWETYLCNFGKESTF